MKNSKKIYHVEDKLPFKLLLPLSIQHTFAMFGASVLVPILFKINRSQNYFFFAFIICHAIRWECFTVVSICFEHSEKRSLESCSIILSVTIKPHVNEHVTNRYKAMYWATDNNQ